jgi:hypothetical protein
MRRVQNAMLSVIEPIHSNVHARPVAEQCTPVSFEMRMQILDFYVTRLQHIKAAIELRVGHQVMKTPSAIHLETMAEFVWTFIHLNGEDEFFNAVWKVDEQLEDDSH